MITFQNNIFSPMLPLTEGAMEQAMRVGDLKVKEFRKVLKDLDSNNWGRYIEDPRYKRWLKTELKRNTRLTQDPEKRVRAWAASIKTSLPAYCFSAYFDESIGEKAYNKDGRLMKIRRSL